MSTVKEIRRENLRYLVERHGTMKALNEALGRKDNTLTQILNSSVNTVNGIKKQMGDKLARTIEESLGLGYGWMDSDHSQDTFKDEEDIIYLKKLNVSGCCGDSGFSNSESDEANFELIGVNRKWYKENINNLRETGHDIITARGDSMEPTFKNGDALIVDILDRDIRRDGIFCVVIEGDLFIKRVQRIPGAVKFISDNRHYDPFEIKASNFDQLVKVVGRVVNSLNLKKYE